MGTDPYAHSIEDADEVLKITQATTGSGAPGVQVQTEKLVAFYDRMSSMRHALREHMNSVRDLAGQSHELQPGGAVPGTQDAWSAIAESVGVEAGTPSLHGNMQAIDDLLTSHMIAIDQTLKSYANQDEAGAAALTKAAR